jgi:hypothetical protein
MNSALDGRTPLVVSVGASLNGRKYRPLCVLLPAVGVTLEREESENICLFKQ